ncbi:MAG: phosphoribosyltransferase family protein [Chthoniobacteraceae bacterium]|nr:phosphoribosyltransferase family protein [Chthoniobacteraceae bacterium]
MNTFEDRSEAGRLLAEALQSALPPGKGNLLVLAIPRGGVVVGAQVARALHAPLDVWLARKIGAPGNPELAVGSVSSHGERFLDERIIESLGVSQAYLEAASRREREELDRRMILFRGSAAPVQVQGRRVLLVDDGVATGSTALSALAALKRGGADRRILAVPVAPIEMLATLERAADQVVVLNRAPDFYAVGQFYRQFEPVSDSDVVRILAEFA